MSGALRLRPATQADAQLLFDWANEPEVRAQSFQEAPIAWETHCAWLAGVLADPGARLYIMLEDTEPVGQVRLQQQPSGAWRISYSIERSHRGQGYGKAILALLENKLCEERSDLILEGEVKLGNIASQMVFESLGYAGRKLETHYVYRREHFTVRDACAFVHRGGVLFLTNNRNALALYDWLSEREDVFIYSDRLNVEMLDCMRPQVVVSYNYSHIIPEEIIATLPYAIVNLHVSYLPYNRGSSPNFWSFIEDTPKGVTIHEITAGLDKGNIIAQQKLTFNEDEETFASTYQKLHNVIQNLFMKIWPAIKHHSYSAYPQVGEGSYHDTQDLQDYLQGEKLNWSENICHFKKRHKLADSV